jgi:hypothetical protein
MADIIRVELGNKKTASARLKYLPGTHGQLLNKTFDL